LLQTRCRANRGKTLHLVFPSVLHQARRAFYLRTTTTTITLPKAEQSSISTVSFILLRAPLYTTPTPITSHDPITLNPHLYLFIDHPTRLSCHASPCIGICLIALLHCWCFGQTHDDILVSFVMSSIPARVVVSSPSRLYSPHTVSPCGFVGVARVVTLCNYCCNRIGFSLSAKSCNYGLPVEHDPTSVWLQVSTLGELAKGGGKVTLIAKRRADPCLTATWSGRTSQRAAVPGILRCGPARAP
jgi:hypothetical protein